MPSSSLMSACSRALARASSRAARFSAADSAALPSAPRERFVRDERCEEVAAATACGVGARLEATLVWLEATEGAAEASSEASGAPG